MYNLAELQKNFQNYLLQQDVSIEKEIIDTQKMSAKIRLEIYRDAYHLRLLEALQQDFPVLCDLIGCNEFNQLGRSYIHTHPSRYRSVRWFGKDLASFMEYTKLYLDQPWIIEMARFEWLLTEAFDAYDAPLITVNEMTTILPEKWPTIRFELHPSLRKLNLYWNIVPLWNAIKEKGKTVLPQETKESINWIIWRKEHHVQFCSLSVDEIFMIDAIAAHHDFGTICEGLCEWVDEQHVAMHAAQLLKRFICDHLISEIKFDL